MSSQVKEKKELFKFYLDNKAFVIKKLSKNDSLSSARHELLSKNNIDFIFVMKDGFRIEPHEENEFSLMDISDGNIIYLKSAKGNTTDDTLIDKPKENTINEKIESKVLETLKQEIKDTDSNLNSQIINKPPADIPIINNIIEKPKEDKKINQINFIGKGNPKETPGLSLTEAIKIKVFINGNFQFECEMDKNWDLIRVRKKLSNYIKNDFLFLLPDGFIINHNEEEIFSLEGILNGDKIYINHEQLILDMNNKNNNKDNFPLLSKNKEPKNLDNNLESNNKKEDNKDIKLMNINIEKNKNTKILNNKSINDIPKEKNIIEDNRNKLLKNLLKDCRKLENIGNLEVYLYPRYEFTSNEKRNSINFMVVGQTGSGKTTLLNAFLNYLLGVKFEDDFRLKLIYEDFGVSMAESQTRDVIIYNIRSFDKNIPPIRVIDTPGFGDTGGLEKDKLISDKIAEKFRSDVSHINAICFVAQSTNAKLTINQKYIFNSIMDLFSEEIKENFIAMLTFCNIIDENPVILEPLKKRIRV